MVPGALARYLSGGMNLMLGNVTVSVPPVAAAEEPLRNGDEPSRRVGPHEGAEAEVLRVRVAQAERRRRVAEQMAHSEAAMRHELERVQAARTEREHARTRAALELLEAVQLGAREPPARGRGAGPRGRRAERAASGGTGRCRSGARRAAPRARSRAVRAGEAGSGTGQRSCPRWLRDGGNRRRHAVPRGAANRRCGSARAC